jgi:hypothetical protein
VVAVDPADTGAQAVGVLDRDGVTVRKVRASGHYVQLPQISGMLLSAVMIVSIISLRS